MQRKFSVFLTRLFKNQEMLLLAESERVITKSGMGRGGAEPCSQTGVGGVVGGCGGSGRVGGPRAERAPDRMGLGGLEVQLLWGLELSTPCIQKFVELPSQVPPGTTLPRAFDNPDHTPPCPACMGPWGGWLLLIWQVSAQITTTWSGLPRPHLAHFHTSLFSFLVIL